MPADGTIAATGNGSSARPGLGSSVDYQAICYMVRSGRERGVRQELAFRDRHPADTAAIHPALPSEHPQISSGVPVAFADCPTASRRGRPLAA